MHTHLGDGFCAMAGHSPDVIARFDPQGHPTYANPSCERVFGPGKHPVLPVLQQAMAAGSPVTTQVPWTDAQGNARQLRVQLTPEPGPEGVASGWWMVGQDATDEHALRQRQAQLEVELSRRDQAFQTLGEHSPDTVVRYDLLGRCVYANRAFLQLCGSSLAAIQGKRPADFWKWGNTDSIEQAINRVIERNQAQEKTYNWTSENARQNFTRLRLVPEYDASNQLVSVLVIGRDITELKQYETRLNEITLKDPLTGLPNRTLLNDRLQTAVAKAVEDRDVGGLLLLNLDRFKEVNDTLGHAHGDHLLVHCGKRLQQLVRAYDTVARLGSDEFAVLLPQTRGVADLVAVAKKINAAMALPFHIGDQPLFLTCSIGIAQFPVDGARANELLQHADSALTEARARGRSGYHLYSAELTKRAQERAEMGVALRRAEAYGQLEVYYQPKVALAQGGAWVGAEALLRWNHPKTGLVTPDRFIGLAEETGLIVGIGTWVLTKACLAAQAWNSEAAQPFKVAVNLSPVQFRQDDLLATVRSVLMTTGCKPEWLELEITESVLLEANEGVRDTLCALRDMGITVAIDDFGTGYSSLAYLKRFPIDVLKVDRSFVRDIGVEHSSTELTKAIVSMGNSLNMQLVAEGVESEAQAAFLLAQGCPFAQGYLYGRPMPRQLFETTWQTAEATRHQIA